MWQFTTLLLAVLVYVASAHPTYLPPYEHVEYAPTVVGHTVHTLPTAVSHQSQTIVHEKRPYLRPIVEHTPLLKAYSPHVKSYAPVVKAYGYEPSTSVAWPGLSYGPVVYSGLHDHGWHPTVNAVYDDWSPGWKSSYGDWNGWPLK